jgi:L-galactose dehydrogenase/L-glyceraldehyde 3-phosphate reductase
MEKRRLGRTGLSVSVLTFGCGAVGGLMTRGAPADQEHAVARALDAGINHFDTAPAYGNGASEQNLGRVLAKLKPDVVVSTKVRLTAENRGGIAAAVAASMEASLTRLGRDHVDLFQFHNAIAERPDGATFGADEMLNEIAPALARMRDQGKTRFIGITAIGETEALHAVFASRAFDTAQVPYNALNPSNGGPLPANYPAQDYRDLLAAAKTSDMGTIGIRVLAGGALSGREERHPLGLAAVEPIGSGASYAADAARARRLAAMVSEGHAASLTEMAMRFAIAHPGLSTTEIGLATLAELDAAIAAIEKGPLPLAALARLAALQASFSGEAR